MLFYKSFAASKRKSVEVDEESTTRKQSCIIHNEESCYFVCLKESGF